MNAKQSVNQGSKHYFEFLFLKEKTHHKVNADKSTGADFPLFRTGREPSKCPLPPHLGYDISKPGALTSEQSQYTLLRWCQTRSSHPLATM